jgi:hypothetical protein
VTGRNPYRMRMVVDIEWDGVPGEGVAEALRAGTEDWLRSATGIGVTGVHVTQSHSLPGDAEVRVSPDGRTALLWDTDTPQWIDLHANGTDAHGHTKFQPTPTEG